MGARTEYNIINNSGLFDAHYYLRHYPDVRRADIDPLTHFIKFGWKEERNPGPLFDTHYYLELNPDVRQKNINPLLHYIRYGEKEGRKPIGDFSINPAYVDIREQKRTIPEKVVSISQPEPHTNLTTLQINIRKGLNYLRINGIRKTVYKVFRKSGVHTKKVSRLHKNLQIEGENNPYATVYETSLIVSTGKEKNLYVDYTERENSDTLPDVKLIAFYLPQFHTIPENDSWWGRGFTEWTNVSKAVPQFVGHYQPRLPGELGYYDLRVPDVQHRQVELARNYGIYGFCFHYYWFNGKRLLERPLDQFIRDPQIDFPFCVCWANENWTRKWDGKSNDVLISQDHSFEYDKLIIHDFVKLFATPRYIRIEDRPLLIVYRADILKDAKITLEYWRNYSSEHGTGNPYIVMAQTFGYSDPRVEGFDAAIEFPPHNGSVLPDVTSDLTFLNNKYNGNVCRYSDMVRTSISRIQPELYNRINTIAPGWDNEARRPGNGLTYMDSTPELYAQWLDAACRFAHSNKPQSERFVFINAWNEWAEASYIEPDRKFGYAYLQATADVLDNLANLGDQVKIRKITQSVDRALASYVVPEFVTPVASIIITVYNHFEVTFNCLKSFQEANDEASFEIIIIDDGSTDETSAVLSKCKSLHYFRNEQNLGFLESCNKAAKTARGQYLVFLNNDTLVTPGWLDSLIETFNNNPRAGLIGSKLIYPNGRLQEAGGLIWKDANGLNFGRDDDPNKPQYNYLREADYCSGASICVPKVIWDELNGFDDSFAPAYYEDVDLAFRIRSHGYSVLYQPFSRVIHVEGITSGTSTKSGIKRYQEINRLKFYDRWKDVLLDHWDNLQPSILYRNQIRRSHALVIDVCTPKPDHDAGSIETYQYLLMLRTIGFEVTFISVVNADVVDHYVADLQEKGIECIYQPYLKSIDEYIKQMGKYFDLVMLFRAPYGGAYIDAVRKYAPQAKVIFHTVDLHFLREQRESELTRKEFNLQENVTKSDELSIMKKADISIVVSDYELNFLNTLGENVDLRVIPLHTEIPGRNRGFEGRKNIMYIGGYLHRPNVDAVLYFVKEIWPLITKVLSDCEFWIVGSNVPQELEELADEKIKVVGYLADLSQVFSECKISIAPLRYGAGIKGKIVTSLSYGVPCVATSIATEGMGLTHELNVLVGDTPDEFASAVVRLYNDRDTWEKLSDNGLVFLNEKHSLENLKIHLRNLITDLDVRPDFRGKIT